MSEGRRAFVVDHNMAHSTGHNMYSCTIFAEEFQSHFSQVIQLGTNCLPDSEKAFNRELNYPYEYFVGKNGLRERVAYKLHEALVKWVDFDLILKKTELNWANVFKKHRINETDFLFFPSTDYYGVYGLINYLKKRRHKLSPSIHFRFIHHPEFISFREKHTTRLALFKALKSVLTNEHRLTLSAETVAYSQLLQTEFNFDVAVLPYPLNHSLVPINWHESERTLSIPGQGRVDKGFFRIKNIAEHLKRLDCKTNYRFFVQNMDADHHLYDSQYVQELNKIPNVYVQESQLSQQAINEMYQEADIILMAYDEKLFKYRGSAVYQESLAVGRPMVCAKDTSHADWVKHYKNGCVASTDEEFAQQIIRLSQQSKKKTQEQVSQARALYQADLERGLNKLFKK